jgi:hypothetical protein
VVTEERKDADDGGTEQDEQAADTPPEESEQQPAPKPKAQQGRAVNDERQRREVVGHIRTLTRTAHGHELYEKSRKHLDALHEIWGAGRGSE